ncbi:MAG: ACP S-malonyltransferase [Blastocatellia bacterium]
MQVLIDYNLEGDADLIFSALRKDGWVELLKIEFVFFEGTPLNPESDDTTVWRFAQSEGMILLTYNRNEDDETSLTATIRQENTSSSLPVLTIANQSRVKELNYSFQEKEIHHEDTKSTKEERKTQ